MSRHGETLRKLQSELDEVMSDAHTLPDLEMLKNLPYLNAIVKEGKVERCYTFSHSYDFKDCAFTVLDHPFWSALSLRMLHLLSATTPFLLERS